MLLIALKRGTSLNKRDWLGYLKSMPKAVGETNVVDMINKINHLTWWVAWTGYHLKLPEGDNDVLLNEQLDNIQLKNLNKLAKRATWKFSWGIFKSHKFFKRYVKMPFQPIKFCLQEIVSLSDYVEETEGIERKFTKISILTDGIIIMPLVIVLGILMSQIKFNGIKALLSSIGLVFSWGIIGAGLLFLAGYIVSSVIYGQVLVSGNSNSIIPMDTGKLGYPVNYENIDSDRLLALRLLLGKPRVASLEYKSSIADLLVENKIIKQEWLDDFDPMVVKAQLDLRRQQKYGRDIYPSALFEQEPMSNSGTDTINIPTTTTTQRERPKEIAPHELFYYSGTPYQDAPYQPETLYQLNTLWLRTPYLLYVALEPTGYVEPWNALIDSDEYFKDDYNLAKLEKLADELTQVKDRLGLDKDYQNKLQEYFDYQTEHSAQYIKFSKPNLMLARVYKSLADFDNQVVAEKLPVIQENARLAIDEGLKIVEQVKQSEINKLDQILREQAYLRKDLDKGDN